MPMSASPWRWNFGLITPIVFHAEEKGLDRYLERGESRWPSARAPRSSSRRNIEGGSFAISNLGMFGIKNFTAVINPPHAGILAVGAGEQRAVVHWRQDRGRHRDDCDDVL